MTKDNRKWLREAKLRRLHTYRNECNAPLVVQQLDAFAAEVAKLCGSTGEGDGPFHDAILGARRVTDDIRHKLINDEALRLLFRFHVRVKLPEEKQARSYRAPPGAKGSTSWGRAAR